MKRTPPPKDDAPECTLCACYGYVYRLNITTRAKVWYCWRCYASAPEVDTLLRENENFYDRAGKNLEDYTI